MSGGILVTLFAFVSFLLFAQVVRTAETQPPAPPAQVVPEPMSHDDGAFESIFDGRTLKDWDGNPIYWRVENGAIVGETSEKNLPKYNSFIIWRGGKPANFELKLDYRISSAGNSGLQYRSTAISEAKWVLRGYQCDIDGSEWGQRWVERFSRPRGLDVERVTGQNYEERGRTFLALTGQLSYVGSGTPQRVVASLGDSESLADTMSNGWNRLHVIARGNQMIHIVNDRVLSMVIDDDTVNRRMEGLLGMQVHVGPPMKVEFRNIRLKTLEARTSRAAVSSSHEQE